MKYLVKIIGLLLVIQLCSEISFAQSVTTSSPASSATNVDSVAVLYTISDPVGNPQQIQVVFTNTSGFYKDNCGTNNVWTLTMLSNAPTPGTWKFKPTDLTNANNPFTASPTTPMKEGLYSVYTQYVRPAAAGGTTLKSTTRTNVYLDLKTVEDTLYYPLANSINSDSIRVKYSLGEAYPAGTAKLIFTGPITNTMTLADNTRRADFKFSASGISSPFIKSSTSSSLPDGTYSVTLQYQDVYSHNAFSTTNSSVVIQTKTPHAVVSYPTKDTIITSNMPLKLRYMLPSQPLAGSAKLLINPGGYSYTLSDTYGSVTDYNINSNIPPDGIYTFNIIYKDFLNNGPDTVSVTNVTIKRTTLTPTLSSPASSSVYSTANPYIKIIDTLLEPCLHDSTYILIKNAGTNTVVDTLFLSDSLYLNDSVSVLNLNANPTIRSSINALPEGTYDFVLSYKDTFNNPRASSSLATNIRVVFNTLTPTITQPSTGRFYHAIPIAYSLPSTALSGSVQIKLVNNTDTITMHMIDVTPGGTTYIDPANNPEGVGPYVSCSSTSNARFIPDGAYKVYLSFQDAYGNPAAYDSVNSITIKTSAVAPTISSPASGSTFSINNSKIPISYTIPETPASVTVTVTDTATGEVVATLVMPESLTCDDTLAIRYMQKNRHIISSLDTLPDGVYNITLSYVDTLLNPTVSTFVHNIIVKTNTLTPTFSSPAANGTYTASSPNIHINYVLPEPPLPGSVKAVLHRKENTPIAFSDTLSFEDDQSFNDSVSILNLNGTAHVTSSSSTLMEGTYDITLSYQDTLGNPKAAVMIDSLSVIIVTPSPVIARPGDEASYTSLPIKYSLPKAPLPGSVKLVLANRIDTLILNMTDDQNVDTYISYRSDPSILPQVVSKHFTNNYNYIPDGYYNVTLSYQDLYGNPVSASTVSFVTVYAPSWSRRGNSGNIDGVNFLGTTDSVPITIKVNNYKAGRLDHMLNNSFLGYKAALGNTTGYNNTVMGANAFNTNVTGYNNTVVGDSAGFVSTGNGNVFIGHQAGADETGNNKLYIGNKSDQTLIYGDFSSGKVLIGNSNPLNASLPGNHKLYVNGGIIADSLQLALVNDWSDYVFDKNYKLKTLKELKSFIEENKHLPNIPSADEISKEGMDIATMDAKLLEKIEELHLYILQLEKNNSQMKREMGEIKKVLKK